MPHEAKKILQSRLLLLYHSRELADNFCFVFYGTLSILRADVKSITHS